MHNMRLEKSLRSVVHIVKGLNPSSNHCLISVCFQVNGTVVVPPVTFIGGVEIFFSGKFVTLETSFGLRVRFDGNHHADVTVPDSYNGLLCGMCGKNKYNILVVPPSQQLLFILLHINPNF